MSPVVLVNGLPAAGKTTLARPLAAALGLPLVSKDVIKEAHADVLGADRPGWSQRDWSQALGRAATEAMWALLADAHSGAVLESSWRADVRPLVQVGLARAGVEVGQVLEVWCEAPLPVLRQRYQLRAARSHPVHGAPLDDAQWQRAAAHAEPLGFGPVYRVDTSGPVEVGAAADWIRRRLDI